MGDRRLVIPVIVLSLILLASTFTLLPFQMIEGSPGGFMITNIGKSSDSNPILKEGFVTIQVRESSEGNTDLNGDGDTSDKVLHVIDTTNNSVDNIGLGSFNFVAGDNLVAFLVREFTVDLNGDGDIGDFVLHVYDPSTKIVKNTGLNSFSFAVDGNLVAFLVREASEGNTDLNGDGDSTDSVVHVFDLSSSTTTNVGFSGEFPLVVKGNLVAFTVREALQKDDLNGDGDQSDAIVHVFDVQSNTLLNTGLGGSFRPAVIDQNLVGLVVPESSQGADLNGDGDQFDMVVQVYDSISKTSTNTGLSASNTITVSEQKLSILTRESIQGNTDLNGDGDTLDSVIHVYDYSSDTTTNLGFALERLQSHQGDLVAFGVKESSQGNTDLNGDGDTSDLVLHVYNDKTKTTTNVGLTTFSPKIDENFVAFLPGEFSDGITDFNGDGDTVDLVPHVFDAGTGTTKNSKLSTGLFVPVLDKNLISVLVGEASQGNTDLNGDGDTSDFVVHVFDAQKNISINTGLASLIPAVVEENKMAFLVPEDRQGNTDLNGDGDTLDRVLHIVMFNNPPDCSNAIPNTTNSVSSFDSDVVIASSSSTVITNIGVSPSHKTVEIFLSGLTDADGDSITLTIDGITQDEPTSGSGKGDKSPDGFGVGTDTPVIRAERLGTGDGRVYEISFTADDGNGGECSDSVFVGVPHGKKTEPVDSGQNFDSTLP